MLAMAGCPAGQGAEHGHPDGRPKTERQEIGECEWGRAGGGEWQRDHERTGAGESMQHAHSQRRVMCVIVPLRPPM